MNENKSKIGLHFKKCTFTPSIINTLGNSQNLQKKDNYISVKESQNKLTPFFVKLI